MNSFEKVEVWKPNLGESTKEVESPPLRSSLKQANWFEINSRKY